MTQWLAGMEITADRLNDGVSPTVITTGLTAASGFTVTNFSGYKIGHTAYIFATVTNTSAISMSSGNITPDVTIASLPSGWWPLDAVNGIYGNGAMDGEWVIVNGDIQIRSAVANIASNTSLRLAASYVVAT